MSEAPPGSAGSEPGHTAPGGFSRPLLALILGQISLHACMAGVRMAAPLQALRQGHSEAAVGVLLALFAIAPIALALPAGRMADRLGYHRPLRLAVGLSLLGGVLAMLSGHFAVACAAALLTGAGANIGLIAIQRRAGQMADSSVERIRIFSWLGLAPALANVVGPVSAGLLIDLSGFRAAFALLMLLPLGALLVARGVPNETPAAPGERSGVAGGSGLRRFRSWDLLLAPGMGRLMLTSWLIAASWDLHAFILPILGHERGISASAIGSILGLFALAVAFVRVLIPLLAHRLSEAQVLGGAMLLAAAVLAVYPLARTAWPMALCAVLLGLALGAVQPMIMSKLHQITPGQRHGEALALRSMAINLSSSLMPLLFGVAGGLLGASGVFWVMAGAVAIGSRAARRL